MRSCIPQKQPPARTARCCSVIIEFLSRRGQSPSGKVGTVCQLRSDIVGLAHDVNGSFLGAGYPAILSDVDGGQIGEVVPLAGCLDVDQTSRADDADFVVVQLAVG